MNSQQAAIRVADGSRLIGSPVIKRFAEYLKC